MPFIATRAFRASLFLACTLTAPLVFAHAHLKQQQPAADAQLSVSPQALTLDFSEGLEAKFSGLTLTGPQQQKVTTGPVTLNKSDARQMIVPVSGPLKAGEYTVDWHVVSVDGHKTKGQYRFSVK